MRYFCGAVVAGVALGLLVGGPAQAEGGCTDNDKDGYTSSDCGGSDCNDSDSAVSPAAAEVCDRIDNDCDGYKDESDALDAARWYLDADGDGYGTPVQSVMACYAPAEHVTNGDDCDDSRANIFPGAEERCNAADEDCNGIIDDDPADASLYYPDADGDGYGDAAASVSACEQPVGFVSNSTDCDDTDGSVWTAAPGLSSSCPAMQADTGAGDSKGGCSTLPGPAPASAALLAGLLALVGRQRRRGSPAA